MRKVLRRLRLAEYGGDELVLATVACAALGWGLWAVVGPAAALAALAPWLMVLWFFRDPERRAPDAAEVLVAPADGRVADVQEVDEPRFVCGRALRVGIFLSPFSVHVNRAPCGGMVMYCRYAPGEFLPAYNPRAPERNEAVELGLVTPEGLKVLVKQIAGVLARRIVCEARPGEALARGARYGMIKFGSRTELYVPAESGYCVAVEVGQQVRGGETPILQRVPSPVPAASSEPGTASTCSATC
jgi:phosphatidylserine decarboxylase